MKKYDVITIFPEMIADYAKISIIARAIGKKFLKITPRNLRDFTNDPHQTVDGRPYGGGVGMVLKPDIMQKAINKIAGAKSKRSKKTKVILLTPQGQVFNHQAAQKLAKADHLVFVCGRYEGFDERIRSMVDSEYSVGDYVLMGGELPALIMIEAIARFVPGVVGKMESTVNESFSSNLLEYPQYTRPETMKVGAKKMSVPKVLLSGDHGLVESWRRQQALLRTQKRRPDLLEK